MPVSRDEELQGLSLEELEAITNGLQEKLAETARTSAGRQAFHGRALLGGNPGKVPEARRSGKRSWTPSGLRQIRMTCGGSGHVAALRSPWRNRMISAVLWTG